MSTIWSLDHSIIDVSAHRALLPRFGDLQFEEPPPFLSIGIIRKGLSDVRDDQSEEGLKRLGTTPFALYVCRVS